MSASRMFLGIDVGTASVRAGLFDAGGRMAGSASSPIEIRRPEADFVEQSSENIWSSVSEAVKQVLADTSLQAEEVVGMGFDATCSLVVLGVRDRPVAVSSGVDRP